MNHKLVTNFFKLFLENTSDKTWCEISSTDSILKMTLEMREAWLAITAMDQENLIGRKTYRGVVTSVKWTFAECAGFTVNNPPLWADAIVNINDVDYYYQAVSGKLFSEW